jgi:hypothetical protein
MILDLGYIIDLLNRKFLGSTDVYWQFADIGGPNFVYWMLCLFAIACVSLLYPLEKVLMQTPSLWRTKEAIIAVIILLMPAMTYLFLDLNTRTMIGFVGLAFAILLIINAIGGTLYFYFRLGAKSTGYVRTKALYIAFGFLITVLSTVLSFIQKGDDLVANIVGPLGLVIGLWLLLRGEQMKML